MKLKLTIVIVCSSNPCGGQEEKRRVCREGEKQLQQNHWIISYEYMYKKFDDRLWLHSTPLQLNASCGKSRFQFCFLAIAVAVFLSCCCSWCCRQFVAGCWPLVALVASIRVWLLEANGALSCGVFVSIFISISIFTGQRCYRFILP